MSVTPFTDGPVFIIAEMSANHGGDLDKAIEILRAAKDAGADAVKLQTYTPDTLTIDCDNEYFQIRKTLWEGRTLYDLYGEAYTPWEWHEPLQEEAKRLEIGLFSTPFDDTAVDFLESLDMSYYKIASFENVDLPLIRKIASTGRPAIMSTGMASEEELDESVAAFRDNSDAELVLLKCTSAYPAPMEEMNLRTIPYLADKYGVIAGLSDHTLGHEVALAAVALGAKVIEKHFCLSREEDGVDAAFSMEPEEFKIMVDSVRNVERALGSVSFSLTEKQRESAAFRRSLFVVEDVAKGEVFTSANVRSIRPGYGLHTRHLEEIIGRTASTDIVRGTPLSMELVN